MKKLYRFYCITLTLLFLVSLCCITAFAADDIPWCAPWPPMLPEPSADPAAAVLRRLSPAAPMGRAQQVRPAACAQEVTQALHTQESNHLLPSRQLFTPVRSRIRAIRSPRSRRPRSRTRRIIPLRLCLNLRSRNRRALSRIPAGIRPYRPEQGVRPFTFRQLPQEKPRIRTGRLRQATSARRLPSKIKHRRNPTCTAASARPYKTSPEQPLEANAALPVWQRAHLHPAQRHIRRAAQHLVPIWQEQRLSMHSRMYPMHGAPPLCNPRPCLPRLAVHQEYPLPPEQSRSQAPHHRPVKLRMLPLRVRSIIAAARLHAIPQETARSSAQKDTNSLRPYPAQQVSALADDTRKTARRQFSLHRTDRAAELLRSALLLHNQSNALRSPQAIVPASALWQPARSRQERRRLPFKMSRDKPPFSTQTSRHLPQHPYLQPPPLHVLLHDRRMHERRLHLSRSMWCSVHRLRLRQEQKPCNLLCPSARRSGQPNRQLQQASSHPRLPRRCKAA